MTMVSSLKMGLFKNNTCFFLVLVFAFSLFTACRKEKQAKCKDCLILHASLDEEEISLDKLFYKIELIPLETTDNSLIQLIEKYDYLNGKHYIFDEVQAILFFFDEEGKYLNRIAKKGQGPGEYKLIYDFALNPKEELIHMSSPYKFIYSYDFEGKHVKTDDLTSFDFLSIRNMHILDDKYFVLWANGRDDNHDWIYMISQETGQIENSFFQTNYLYNLWASDVFFTYNNEIYFSRGLFNIIYKVTKEGLEEAYEWNFGKKTMDISRYDLITSLKNITRDLKTLEDKLKSGEIPYENFRNFQNKHY